MAYKYDIGNITESRGSYSVRFGNYQDDNFVSKFFGKTEYDNPKKAAEAFHKKIVDSGWSSLRGTMGDSPLRDAIRKAYKEIGKGKNTTTDDIYQKIKNLNIVKGKDKLTVFSAITKRLAKDKLPYKKGATMKDARVATFDKKREERLKTGKVKQPTLVTQSKGAEVAGVIFPESGPRSKENFIKALKKFDSTPRVAKGQKRKFAIFRNKFFPAGIATNSLNKLLANVREKENIPPRPTKEPNIDKVLRETSKEKFSGKVVEDQLLRGKKTSTPSKVLDLAHKLSLQTSKRFNIQQPTQSLALQQPFINQVIGRQYERKLDRLYDLQENLIKNKPADYKRKIERLNKIITSVVNDSDGRVIGVVIDEKTLKPRMYGNVEIFKDTLDQGFFDKNVKNMPKGEARFVVNNLYKDSLPYARGAGADISKLKNINIEELKASAVKDPKYKTLTKKAIKELAKFPETTKAYGVVGTAMDKSIYKKIANLGCYDSLLAQGGRVGFATGSNCFEKGVKAIESGNIKDGAQTRNFTKLMDSVKTGGARAATSFLKFVGKGKTFAVTAGVGVGAGALVKKFMNDDPSTYLTNDKQANAMILDTIDQKERQERMDAIGDAPELLDEANIAANIAVTAAPIPGSAAVYAARRKPFKTRKAMGPARAALGPVGKALSGFATPAGIAALTPLNVASSLYEGDSAYEIATDPLNYLGPALAGNLSKEATRGMGATSKLAKSLRLGMSPGAIKMVSRRFGLPGLALSAGISLYELADDYKSSRGIFGKKE